MELIDALNAIGTPAAVIVQIMFTYVLWRYFTKKLDERDAEQSELLKYLIDWLRANNGNGRKPPPPPLN